MLMLTVVFLFFVFIQRNMATCFSLVFLLAVLGVKVLRQLDAGKFHFTDGTGLVEDAEIDLVEYRTDIAVLHV